MATTNHFVIYAADHAALGHKVDAIARARGLFATVGRNVGGPNRSAVIETLVDEEIARLTGGEVAREAPIVFDEPLLARLRATREDMVRTVEAYESCVAAIDRIVAARKDAR